MVPTGEVNYRRNGYRLFTWKPSGWPYANLKALVDKFDAGEVVSEPWRCTAHRKVKVGDRAYLYKQGPSPNGIFGVARIIGPPVERTEVIAGQARFEVPLRFELLLDPEPGHFILTKERILELPAQFHLNTQANGITVPDLVAEAIEAAAERIRQHRDV